MAVLQNPIIRVEIDGKRQLSNYFLKEELEIADKNEPLLMINFESNPSVSGWCDVSLGSIEIVNKIMIEAPALKTLTNTLRIIKDDDSVLDIDGIVGLQILSFNDVEGSKIKQVQIKTDSEDKVAFDCKIITA